MSHLDNVHQDQLWLEEVADNAEEAVEAEEAEQVAEGDDEMLYDM